MVLYMHRVWLAAVCGIVACLPGCSKTESAGKVNAATHAEQKNTGSHASATPIAAAPDNLPQPDPEFHGKIGATYHDSTADKSMFDSPKALERHTTQYFEMMGNRGIYRDGWMASKFHLEVDGGSDVPDGSRANGRCCEAHIVRAAALHS